MQIIEDEAEYVLVIEDQRRKRPNAPGTSKRHHFERANQKGRRGDFEWHQPQEKSSHKNDPPSHEEGRSRGGHQDTEDSKRFTWTAPDTEPHVEPPRPAGWKPLVLVPQLVQLSEETERKLVDQRMKEWSKDQEEYAEQQYRETERKREEERVKQEETIRRQARLAEEEEVKRKERRKAAAVKRCQELEEARTALRQEIEALEKEEQGWAERKEKILAADNAFAEEHCPPQDKGGERVGQQSQGRECKGIRTLSARTCRDQTEEGQGSEGIPNER
jgi:hypothetical protein